jgi:hypothetical protein
MDRPHLAVMQIETVSQVAPRNDERVQRRHREPVAHGDGDGVRPDDSIIVNGAEHTVRPANGMALPDGATIRGVPGAFVRVAQPAERVEVLLVIAAAVLARQDVVHIEGALIPRNPTQLAAKASSPEGVVSCPARNLLETDSAVLPNRGTPLDPVGFDASSHKPTSSALSACDNSNSSSASA